MPSAPLALAASLVLSLVAFAAPRPAVAAEHRVAVLDGGSAIVRALDLALSVWGVEVSAVAVTEPGAVMPLAVERARAVAKSTGSDVVVWISAAQEGYALWVYDASSDHASARRLEAGPPFDNLTAAGIALSIKTLLRASVIAPPLERFGAVTQAEEATWRVEVALGGAVRTGLPKLVEPRAWVGVSLWPAALHHTCGISLDIEGGPGIRADGALFTGTLLDIAARLAIVARIALGPAVALEPSLGGGFHVVSLDGFVVRDQATAVVRRFDVALEPRVALDVKLFGGRVHLGPWLGLAYLTRAQRFNVNGEPVLTLAPLVAQAALRLTLGLQ